MSQFLTGSVLTSCACLGDSSITRLSGAPLLSPSITSQSFQYGGPHQKSFPPSYLGRVRMKRYAVINLAYAMPMQRIGRAYFTTTAG